MISEERFFAWLDGELDPAEAAVIDELVAADPELQRRAETHRAFGRQLREAFDPIPGAQVVNLSERRRRARPISRPMQLAAMAATLVLGVVAGTMIDSVASGPIDRENGRLVASGKLEQALYTRLASVPADEGARIGLTFRDGAGDLCRSFTDEGSSGLACHKGGDWRIRGLFQADEGQQGEYRMAAGLDPRLAELVDSAMAGEPLDAEGERKALDALR